MAWFSFFGTTKDENEELTLLSETEKNIRGIETEIIHTEDGQCEVVKGLYYCGTDSPVLTADLLPLNPAKIAEYEMEQEEENKGWWFW